LESTYIINELLERTAGTAGVKMAAMAHKTIVNTAETRKGLVSIPIARSNLHGETPIKRGFLIE
jgi:hypothetical protein